MQAPRIAQSADVDPTAVIGEGTSVWDLVQVRAGARIGRDCVLGRGCAIDTGVVVGDACKIQSNALVYAPAVLGQGVFVGPAALLTNDRHPRAVTPDGTPKRAEDWQPEGVRVGDGASIGAGAVLVGGVTVGAWALVAAGSVVARDVPSHALVAGVPAAQLGWVGRSGHRLVEDGSGGWRCPHTGESYRLGAGGLELAP